MSVSSSRSDERQCCDRKFGRARLGLPAKLTLVGGREHCRISDLSLDGAKIEIDLVPELGEAVLLIVDGHELFGSIVWVGSGCAGIRFEEHITKKSLLHFGALAPSWQRYVNGKTWEAAQDWVNGA